jgi:predicted PurR-regulated permease PerM
MDNITRPLFARFGKLQLPPLAFLFAIAAGTLTFGARGLLLGPLALRLLVEVMGLVREERFGEAPRTAAHVP